VGTKLHGSANISCLRNALSKLCGTPRVPAEAVIFTRTPLRRSSAKDRKERTSCLFGEQPGDQEDRQGHPFVGPAGRLLDKALVEARIPRERVYVTNAVKHFKWIWRGKRRLHQKPAIRQVAACRPWLEAELESVRPKIVICLGATAAQAVLEKSVPITKERGKFIESSAGLLTFITIHPSAIYRHREKDQQEKEYRRFAEELKLVSRKLRSLNA
jgi:uracil-DNA glycosylase family protein